MVQQRDPVIAKARELWNSGSKEDAMKALIKRVDELTIEVRTLRSVTRGGSRPSSKSEPAIIASDTRSWVRATLFIILVIILIFLALYGKALLEDMQNLGLIVVGR